MTQRQRIQIRDLSLKGEGIGQVDSGQVFFVPDLLPGEAAWIEPQPQSKRQATLFERLHTSPDRIEPRCPYFGQCGGCQLQHLHPNAQAQWKSNRVAEALQRIGHFAPERIAQTQQPFLPAAPEFSWNYRNKVQVHYAEISGRIQWGYIAQDGVSLLPITRCLLHPEPINTLLNTLGSWWQNRPSSLRACHLHQASIRLSQSHQQILISLYASGSVQLKSNIPLSILDTRISDSLPHAFHELTDTLKQELLVSHPTYTLSGLLLYPLSKPPRRSCSAMDSQGSGILLTGIDQIEEQLGTVHYLLSSQSFFQIHPLQAEQMIHIVQKALIQTSASTIWDLYCGTGTFSLPLAQLGGTVHGVEIVPDAIDMAQKNAERNHLTGRTHFYCAPAERLAPQLIQDGLRPDLIVVDPPRRGCAPQLLDTILTVSPSAIVYVSCHPETLARDLAVLCEKQYTLQEWTPIDLFPWTTSVECVCLLKRVR